FFFSRVGGVGAGDPVLGAPPADAQTFQGHADGFAREGAWRPAFVVADRGDQIQGPQARRFAEETGAVMQQILQRVGVPFVQEGPDGNGPGGFLPQARQALAGQGVNGVADGACRAAQLTGQGRWGAAVGAGQQDWAAADGKRLGGAKPFLQLLALGRSQSGNKDARFHTSLFVPSCNQERPSVTLH